MSRPITDIMRDIARGHFVEQATEELQKIVLAVLEENKTGTLTLKIKVSKNDENQVFYDAEIDGKMPKQTLARTMFFVDSEGNSVRRDPRQTDMFTKKAEDQAEDETVTA
jgi:hypothetical protein